MNLFEATTLFLVMLPLAAMPSSSVALVLVRSANAGRMNGAMTAMGIVAGDLVFVAMALAGMSVLAEWLGAFFSIVKYVAGAYLIWLGYRLFTRDTSVPLQTGSQRTATYMADFLAGLFLTLGDVKAILFYASLFPTLIDMNQIGTWDVAMIVSITVATVGGVKLGYAYFAASIVNNLRGRISFETPRKLAGLLLVGCGSALILNT